jgi:DNA-directed RNA polymerase subunit beta'
MAETPELSFMTPSSQGGPMLPPMTAIRGERETRRKFNFNAIRIRLASPDVIRSWSHGEVLKPETINYRSFKPERDGLFCEKIFGPVKDWQCACGRYKMIRYRGIICDKCGVEVTQASVRRERMGHVELAVPVSHIWYFKGVPSRIGHLVDMSIRNLERILYYESYVVIDPGNTPFRPNELLSEEQYQELKADTAMHFEAGMGAGAIRKLLERLDLDDLSGELRTQVRIETSVQRRKDTLKRLKIVEAFRQSGNKPEWMILTVVPVLPPDLRPLVPLEGGRFATSDLNDLYRRVINRNNRLKKLIEIRAPEVILRNEKRMLQEAVDALFDNGRRTRAVRGQGNRPLKSLSDMLKGKQGRFRQNLLGKRVDYSGRSVIVVGPELRLHECGLPQNMAIELFKPFIIRKLEETGETVKNAKKLVEREGPGVWEILSEIIKDHPVMLNRAPTLHRLGIQAFQPVLVEGKAIRLHPLVCTAFNADFDGDQMAVHIPLSFVAQIECRELLLAPNNILLPASGRPVATPSQDIVLGCYYLTKPQSGGAGEGRKYTSAPNAKGLGATPCVYGSADEVRLALARGAVDLHTRIRFRVPAHKITKGVEKDEKYEDKYRTPETTVGRVLFNDEMPDQLPFLNKTLDKKQLEDLVATSYHSFGRDITAALLDRLKRIGFNYATRAGVTVGIDDFIIPPEKREIIEKANREVEKVNRAHRDQTLSANERYNKLIELWTGVTNQVEEHTMEGLRRSEAGFNPIFMMIDSGSRGNKEQVRQLAGMRGLITKPQKKVTGASGEIIEQPIISNLKEGLTVLEFFVSTHGARKGLADTALKTADAGYLTRRLVDVAQDMIITMEDCGTILGVEKGPLKNGEEVVEPLCDRILGRVNAEDVYARDSNELLVEEGTLITEEVTDRLEEAGVERMRIRSVLTCEARRGVCVKCYGRDLATGLMVSMGEAVGVIAAQSIGEPGTQLTLRTFHFGGAASLIVEQSKVRARSDGIIRYEDGLRYVTTEDVPPRFVNIGYRGEMVLYADDGTTVVDRYEPRYGAIMFYGDSATVKKDEVLYEMDNWNTPIVVREKGIVRFVDIKEKVTLRDEIDETTKQKIPVIAEDREKILQPHIEIVTKTGTTLNSYPLPTGARLQVREDQVVRVGDVLAKIRRESSRTRDITGGLPRVSELFEARKPKDQAVISEIDGIARVSKGTRGTKKITVENEHERKEYQILPGKQIYVHESLEVRAGDRLTDGPINPHDILKVKGINKVQEYLVDQIQEIYRLQGVRIDDKHIEVIVRQMLQKVRVEDPGDTNFLQNEAVDKIVLREELERIRGEGGKPASFEPLLLGITKASLSTHSFVAAASFQETTRILTEASVNGAVDPLRGLKENVALGRLIPAGTGLPEYRKIRAIPVDEVAESFPDEAASQSA